MGMWEGSREALGGDGGLRECVLVRLGRMWSRDPGFPDLPPPLRTAREGVAITLRERGGSPDKVLRYGNHRGTGTNQRGSLASEDFSFPGIFRPEGTRIESVPARSGRATKEGLGRPRLNVGFVGRELEGGVNSQSTECSQ